MGSSRVCSCQIVILSPYDPETNMRGVPTSDSGSVPPFSCPRRSLGPPDGHIPPQSRHVKPDVCRYHLLRFAHTKPLGSLEAPPGGSPSSSTLVLPRLSGICNAHQRPAHDCFLQGIMLRRPRPRPPETKSIKVSPVSRPCATAHNALSVVEVHHGVHGAPSSHSPVSQRPAACRDLRCLNA